nr:hypothetical protein [Tanacetum cinerariifolium]
SKIGEADINTLTMEQYLALTLENQTSSVVKPKIGGNVNFKIKSQFMRELREDTFLKNKNDDAHEHVKRILDIVNRLPPRTINTWDLLKKAFIQRYCPLPKTANQLEEIHNFKQEGDETLYQAWERYNDLLYKCSTHDLNSHQKDVKPMKELTLTKNFRFMKRSRTLRELKSAKKEVEHDEWLGQATGTKIGECKAILTKDGLPLYKPFYYSPVEIEYFSANLSFMDEEIQEEIKEGEEIKEDAIQTMADHSQEWHDRSISKKISNGSSDGIESITNKLDSLRIDKKNIKENVHAIKVGCETYEGAYLNKEFPLHEEVKNVEGVKKLTLTEMITKYMEESAKKEVEHDEWLGQATGTKIGECKAILTKDGLPLYKPFYYSPVEIEYFSANLSFMDEEIQEEIKEGEEIKEVTVHHNTTPRMNELYIFVKSEPWKGMRND